MKSKEKDSLKTRFMILAGLVILFIGLPTVNAFASTFLPDKTMTLYKGETGEYCIYLQNTGEEDLTQVINVFEGEEYIRNLGEINKEFNIPAGTRSDDFPVCMKVKLPWGSEKGVKYAISYGVANAKSENKGEMVPLAPLQIRQKFYLTESLEERGIDPTIVYLSVSLTAIAVLIAVGYMYYRKTSKSKTKKKTKR